MGIVSIATTSNGVSYCGKHLEKVRQSYHINRSNLQKIGTKSAKKKLKRLSGKESRFRTCVNHTITKEIVLLAKGTNQAISIENLKGIGMGTTVRKENKAKHSSWAFFQFKQFIKYKSELNGVNVVEVNPRNTSRTCSKCSHCEKANRKSQSLFLCKACGYTDNADLNAAKNIQKLGLLSI